MTPNNLQQYWKRGYDIGSKAPNQKLLLLKKWFEVHHERITLPTLKAMEKGFQLGLEKRRQLKRLIELQKTQKSKDLGRGR